VITRLSGKWKVSQNQPAQNQATVIEGLRAQASEESVAMAALVEAGAEAGKIAR
jgi:transcriptional regulator